jgi:hypothetical protein
MSYKFGGDWVSAGRIQVGGAPLKCPVPSASLSFFSPVVLYEVGLYISVTITGNAADLSVHARLTACLNDACDGDITWGVGTALTALGFPFSLLEFDDLAFVDCPADEDNMMMMIAAGGGAVLLIGGGVLAAIAQKKKANSASKTSTSTATV